ncbi:hypothetical protein H0H81_001880, partial [Sphagnurus paluster]
PPRMGKQLQLTSAGSVSLLPSEWEAVALYDLYDEDEEEDLGFQISWNLHQESGAVNKEPRGIQAEENSDGRIAVTNSFAVAAGGVNDKDKNNYGDKNCESTLKYSSIGTTSSDDVDRSNLALVNEE